MLGRDQLPLLTIQQERTAEAPRIYRPHAQAKPKTFDWDAITPTCTGCGARSGSVSTHTGLCPVCDPPVVEQAPVAKAPRVKVTREPGTARAPRRRTGRPRGRPSTCPHGSRRRIDCPDCRAERNARKRNGRRPGRPPAPVDVDAVVEAYTGGQLIGDIAQALRVDRGRIKAALLEAGVELRNDRGRHLVPRTCPHGLAQPSCQDCRDERNARRRTGRPRASMANVRNPIDEDAALRMYLDGATAPAVADAFGVTPKRIRDIVQRAGHQLRDDRSRGGSKPKVYDPDLVEQVRELYARQGLTQAETGERLGISSKVVWRIVKTTPRHRRPRLRLRPLRGRHRSQAEIVRRYQAGEAAPAIARDYDCTSAAIYYVLRKHGISERHGHRSGPGHDGALALKAAIAETGATSREIKAWGLQHGLLDEIRRGLPPLRLVAAYADAHLMPVEEAS